MSLETCRKCGVDALVFATGAIGLCREHYLFPSGTPEIAPSAPEVLAKQAAGFRRASTYARRHPSDRVKELVREPFAYGEFVA